MAINKKDRICAARRALRIRGRLKKGTQLTPRLSVFRSLKHIYAQMIDDVAGITLVSSSSKVIESQEGDKKDMAHAVGLDLAKKAKEKGITAAIFDRGRYRYLGRAQALAQGVREGGIQF